MEGPRSQDDLFLSPQEFRHPGLSRFQCNRAAAFKSEFARNGIGQKRQTLIVDHWFQETPRGRLALARMRCCLIPACTVLRLAVEVVAPGDPGRHRRAQGYLVQRMLVFGA